MASVIATVTTFQVICSVCDKAFGNYSSCARQLCKFNTCRAAGASGVPVPNIVGRHERNVGGRQGSRACAHSSRQDELDADVGDPDDGAGGTEADAGQLESESG